jgi:predicted O-methyltransferase YrrM
LAKKPYVVRFLQYLSASRKAESSLGDKEHDLLSRLAQKSMCIVEVGVYEGVTSAVFCQTIAPGGRIYLVDPYFRETRFEKLLGVSFTEFIAKKSVQPWMDRVDFVRATSVDACKQLAPRLSGKVDLVFIDARHEYQHVREDFYVWSPLVAPDGVIAFDDTLDPAWGPGLLCSEIAQGKHGDWQIIEQVGQVTTARRRH